ncbi:MAG: hypothetical protein E7082_07315 [Bacteroidales bacterium]|nr:hypothetical protein [Bacteroidales bacterium]
MKLFNKDGQGAAEIVAAVGLIANDITFDKWEPVLPFGIRDVVAIVGHEPVAALAEFYENDEIDSQKQSALKYLQQAVAFFTWLKIIPTLDAQHDTAGRSRRLGENEKGLTALQEFKDEENILRLAYEATDALVETLEVNQFPFWVNSHKYKLRNSCLIHTKEQFDEYYSIGSYRLFITLLPIMREVQQAELAPVLGNQILSLLLERSQRETDMFGDIAARAVVLFTMQKAVERLPVEVIPDGVVQVQQSQPVKSRLKAEQSARMAVAASLGADARRCIERLQQLVSEYNAESTKPVPYIGGPITHSKGLSF